MNFYKRYILPLFVGRRFYWSFVAVILLFVLSYNWTVLYPVAQISLLFVIVMVLLDYSLLFLRKEGLLIQRMVSDRFSNGDINKVKLFITNKFHFRIHIKVIDEIPVQFQQRDFSVEAILDNDETKNIAYDLRPVERGEYIFNDTNVFVKSPLQLIVRRIKNEGEQMVKVLPSYLPLRQFELIATATTWPKQAAARSVK
jgi:uncharacterized protein (DUF58 family)